MATKQRPTSPGKAKPATAGRSKKGTLASLATEPRRRPSPWRRAQEFGLNRKMFARLTGYSKRVSPNGKVERLRAARACKK